MPNVVYRVTVAGIQEAIAGLKTIPEAAAAANGHLFDSFKSITNEVKSIGGVSVKAFGSYASGVEKAKVAQVAFTDTAVQGTTTLSERANKLADAFKMVSRDIGTVGGAAAQAFTHAADEALSVIGIITKGGLGAVLAGVGLAAGAVALAYSLWNDETEESKRLAVEAEKSHKALVAASKDGANQAFEATKKLNAEQTRRLAIEKDLLVAALEQDKLAKMLEASKDANVADRVTARAKAEKDSDAAIAKAKEERETAWASYRVQINKELNKEITRNEVDEQEERRKKAQAIAEKRAQEEAARNQRSAESAVEFDSRMAREAMAREALQMQAAVDVAAAEKKLDDDEAKRKEDMAAEDRARFLEEQERDAARMDSLRASDQAIKAALREQTKAQAALREEQTKAMLAAKMQEVAQIAQAAVMMAASPVVAELTSQVHALAMANRETYRDLIIFNEEWPALIAAKAQAVLAGIAAEATGRAAMEFAEAGAMTALGIGYLAIPGMQGFAAPAFASAASHAASGVAFGALAGATFAGAVAIGSVRGEGGLVALTKAEQEEQDRKRTSDGGGSSFSGGGPSGGMYGGGGERGGRGTSIVVNINNEPGSIAPEDQDRAAVATARHVARAQRSWFARQQMGG